ncbi:MAG TPA: MerR family transcriptional regulator [Acidimicrobiales bacterium]|nr:MerR family transcriptional regulator [Acidimicrobiales bacterium]
MSESYTIGELARAAGVHVETVRYYERRGLVEPPPRTASGYRQYSADDLWRLQFVVRAKQLGFTLAEVAELLGHGGAENVLGAARAKIAAVEAQVAELERTRCRLETLARLCEDGDANCVTLRVP